MKKICVVGPESSGKSDLASALSIHLQTQVVPEYARTFLETRTGYSLDDLLLIAKGQLALEREIEKEMVGTKTPLVYDTDLLVIKVWSQYKFGELKPWIESEFHSRAKDLYLLCFPDLPWETDPLRENPDPKERMEIFGLYKSFLDSSELPYEVITGLGKDRLENAIRAVKTRLTW